MEKVDILVLHGKVDIAQQRGRSSHGGAAWKK